MDWIDDFLADEPITLGQIATVESLLVTVPYNEELKQEIERVLLDMTSEQANNLIYKLRFDNRPTDPREQFKQFEF